RNINLPGEIHTGFPSALAEGGTAHRHVLHAQIEITILLHVESAHHADVPAVDDVSLAESSFRPPRGGAVGVGETFIVSEFLRKNPKCRPDAARNSEMRT